MFVQVSVFWNKILTRLLKHDDTVWFCLKHGTHKASVLARLETEIRYINLQLTAESICFSWLSLTRQSAVCWPAFGVRKAAWRHHLLCRDFLTAADL